MFPPTISMPTSPLLFQGGPNDVQTQEQKGLHSEIILKFNVLEHVSFKSVILSTHCDLMTLLGSSVCGWGPSAEECV